MEIAKLASLSMNLGSRIAKKGSLYATMVAGEAVAAKFTSLNCEPSSLNVESKLA
ncbi:hypothetical protein [Paenibacillus sp. NPDC058174]|uniref:hypothetical protein n=1 Tax=Paenibacillus sp. NPDC058174 TaxID=3346366 RepID=UPI0036D8C41F